MRKDRTQTKAPTEYLIAQFSLPEANRLVLDHHNEIVKWWVSGKECLLLVPAKDHASWSIAKGFLGWL